MTGPVEWNFPPRNVSFSVGVGAVFHPSVGSASVSVPWMEAAGKGGGTLEFATPVTVGPLSSLEVDTKTRSGSRKACGSPKRWPDAIAAYSEKSLGPPVPVTLELVRRLQIGVLPVSVALGGAAGDSRAGCEACVPLAPLLMASDSAGDDERNSRVRKSEVFAIRTETVGLAGLYRLEVRVFTDVPVLSQEMLSYLRPCCFTVDCVRRLPNELSLSRTCEDIFVNIYPQLGMSTACLGNECKPVRSWSRPHDTAARFEHPVVWLLGTQPMNVVREWLQNEELVVEVHDRDKKPTEAAATESRDMVAEGLARKPEEAIHPHGVARFRLAPLLDPCSLELHMRADVYPARGNKKRLRSEAMGAGLRASEVMGEREVKNTGGGYEETKLEVAPDYLSSGTVCTVRASLAMLLPKAASIQEGEEAVARETWAATEARDGESNIWVTRQEANTGRAAAVAAGATGGGERALLEQTGKCRAKVRTTDGKELVGPWRQSKEEAEDDERDLLEVLASAPAQDDGSHYSTAVNKLHAKPSVGVDSKYERYGRIVMVVDDKDSKAIKPVLDIVREHNAKILNMDPVGAAMLTRLFSDAEKADPHLDVLTGFSVLDGKSRVMVVEGLRDRALKNLLAAVPRDSRANEDGFKLLHNPAVGFSERIYADFGPKLKQLKIRMPLEELAAKPELYSITGVVSEGTSAGMECPDKLMALKQATRFAPLRQGSSFPNVSHLENLEILYGDAMCDAELLGEPAHTRPGSRQRRKSQKGSRRRSQQGRVSSPNATLNSSFRSPTSASGSPVDSPRQSWQAGVLEQAVAEHVPGPLADSVGPKLSRSASTLPRRAALDARNKEYTKTLDLRASASAPDLKKANVEAVKQRSALNAKINDILGTSKLRERQTPFLEGKEVFLYSGQKNNSAELQKQWMRETMAQNEHSTVYTFCPHYESQTFGFSADCVPGPMPHHPWCANNSYANLQGDTRAPWRPEPARPKEDFRKPARDVGPFRAAELHEAYVEGEMTKPFVGQERSKPVSAQISFEPNKVPHLRRHTQRPFDRSNIKVNGDLFGPKGIYDSVHYQPRVDCTEEALSHNLKKRAEETAKIRDGKNMKSYSQGATRSCITDLDRCEPVLKDPPERSLRGRVDDRMPSTIRTLEKFHENGRPDLDFQARMRENDTAAPYDVNTGAHVPRDRNVGTKLGWMSGTLSKAPYQHGGDRATTRAPQYGRSTEFEYPSADPFNTTRPPPKAIHREDHVHKLASRAPIGMAERMKAAYRRPKDYGVSVPSV